MMLILLRKWCLNRVCSVYQQRYVANQKIGEINILSISYNQGYSIFFRVKRLNKRIRSMRLFNRLTDL
jgi:hypothetical protein